MQTNVGTVDRIIRIILALAIAVLCFTRQVSGTAALVLGAVAVILLITGVAAFCPLYIPLKLSTKRKN